MVPVERPDPMTGNRVYEFVQIPDFRLSVHRRSLPVRGRRRVFATGQAGAVDIPAQGRPT